MCECAEYAPRRRAAHVDIEVSPTCQLSAFRIPRPGALILSICASIPVQNFDCYLSERMLDDHLFVEVRYARKQVSEGSLCLIVDLFLCFGQLPIITCRSGNFFANKCLCLFHNGLANVVTHPVYMQGQFLDVVAIVFCVLCSLRIRLGG